MSTYRVYSLKSSGQIAGPPALVEAATDREALLIARRFGLGLKLEVWQLARLVATLLPEPRTETADFPPGPVVEDESGLTQD